MPAANQQKTVDAILSACEVSGGYAHFDNSTLRRNPRKFVVITPDNRTISLWVYVWTLTHGGRPTLPDEYRIQMTGITSPLALNTGSTNKTVLIGHEPQLDAFAGFDIAKHRNFTQGSPSVQINIRTIRKSLSCGIAFDKKSNDEIAVGFRYDNFINYIMHSDQLHEYGADEQTVDIIENLGQIEAQSEYQEIVTSYEQSEAPPERKKIVSEVSRLSRDSNFREKVLRAYGYKCAITGIQLSLPEASHILPVIAPESNDSVNNGLSLTPTYHRAFDKGIIYLDVDYSMKPNDSKLDKLSELNLGAGSTAFLSQLGEIILPADRHSWPSKELIETANEFRQI